MYLDVQMRTNTYCLSAVPFNIYLSSHHFWLIHIPILYAHGIWYRSEQEEYEREGIAWTPIPFFNNKY